MIILIEEKESERKSYSERREALFYKPKFFTNDDMQSSIKRAMKEKVGVSIRRNVSSPNYTVKNVWKKLDSRPIYTAPIKLIKTETKPEEPKPEEKPKVEEEKKEPFWDGVGWEEWAYQIYDNYPEMRKYLPEWFITAMEQNDKKQ